MKSEKIHGFLKSRKNGIDYSFIFEYCLKYARDFKGDAYIFEIWEEGQNSKRKFSFQLRVMENGDDLKVVDLYAYDYIGKGISIAIILHSKEIFKKRIISSSNKYKSFIAERNSNNAIEKVWKPMVNQGLAQYNTQFDYYYTI